MVNFTGKFFSQSFFGISKTNEGVDTVVYNSAAMLQQAFGHHAEIETHSCSSINHSAGDQPLFLYGFCLCRPAQIRRRGYSFLAFKMAVIAAFGGRDLKTAFHWYARAVRLCPTNMNLYLLPIRKLAMTFSRKEDLPWLHEFLAMPLPAKDAH